MCRAVVTHNFKLVKDLIIAIPANYTEIYTIPEFL